MHPGPWYTIDQILKAAGIEITNRQIWRLGALARDRWRRLYQQRPLMNLAPKSKGVGTETKAHYPVDWSDWIIEEARKLEAGDHPQLPLFNDKEPKR